MNNPALKGEVSLAIDKMKNSYPLSPEHTKEGRIYGLTNPEYDLIGKILNSLSKDEKPSLAGIFPELNRKLESIEIPSFRKNLLKNQLSDYLNKNYPSRTKNGK